ncbi:3'-5' exonuclease family protein [Paraburkholderia guartelaensis]|uniref:3'-5' exoribonuclease n=1 Tax=Paraburkholderia guartelaensis TaxID=2546446 RepID=UPI002AB6DF7B|nr:3'-5' exoribonuclease [Paraburkholderia guartelaensis]
MTEPRFYGAIAFPIPEEACSGRKTRYFIDTEYTGFGSCQLISFAIAGENGDEFYGERTDYDTALCSDFAHAVVLPQLGRIEGCAMPFDRLREALRSWLADIPSTSRPVLCYDHETDLNLLRFLLAGPLPRGWRLENIAGRCDAKRRAAYFEQHGGEHHALHDARANFYAFAG